MKKSTIGLPVCILEQICISVNPLHPLGRRIPSPPLTPQKSRPLSHPTHRTPHFAPLCLVRGEGVQYEQMATPKKLPHQTSNTRGYSRKYSREQRRYRGVEIQYSGEQCRPCRGISAEPAEASLLLSRPRNRINSLMRGPLTSPFKLYTVDLSPQRAPLKVPSLRGSLFVLHLVSQITNEGQKLGIKPLE